MPDDLTLLPHADEDIPRNRFLPQVSPPRPQPPPAIECPEIDYRSWRTWQDAGAAMSRMPVLSFGQAFRPENEIGLAPAAVALAHQGNGLIVYAELSDADIFNPVRKHGAHAYQSGDVLEIFLRADDEGNYFEHHITPDNYTLQLSFPTLAAFGENCSAENPNWADPFATKIPVPSRVLVQPEIEMWRVLAVVPLGAITSNREKKVPAHWRFSICRYDHTHGRDKPVLSSTTPYRFANFHHQDLWGRLALM